MRRRDFIALLGGAASTWPLASSAQQQTMPVVGFLRLTNPDDSVEFLTQWRQGLKETGYVEGHNLAVEYRWAEDHLDRLPALASDLVDHQVSVIVGAGNAATFAAKAATTSIPIVFVIGEDPIKVGLVTSLNRPGGNLTGATFVTTTVATKKLQLLSEVLGKSATIAFLLNPDNPQTESELHESQIAAESLGDQILILRANTETQIQLAFATAVQQNVGGLLVAGDGFFFSKRMKLVALAARNSIPTAYQWRDAVAAGGLMSYGPSLPDSYRQAGIYVGRVLKGEKAANLPVMLPTTFDFAVNLKTAKTLGLTVSNQLQLLADEVIE
jgi:putative ABC transport system substrate-binding protein